MLVFKIATVPDVAGLRLLHGLPAALADNEVVEFVYQKSRAVADVSNAPDVLGLHLQRVVSISCALCDDQQFRVVSLAQADHDEGALLLRFFNLLAQTGAQAVSWHGQRFDAPVLQCRALVNGVSAHGASLAGSLDFASQLAMQSGEVVSLHELAGLCGLPRKARLRGKQMWEIWRTGRADEIHAHCDTDAVICYLVSLRLALMRGVLDSARYAEEIRSVRDALAAHDAPHWRGFLADW